jgi:hypothetical protein
MITKPLTREEHYQQLAIDFKGQAKLRRCDAAVHVEAAQDQRFWDTIFYHFIPQWKFHFISHSRTWSGTESSGVTQCLSFKPYLGKNFFIQTYTYSIENHYCAAPGLDFVCKRASGETNGIFNFEFFLKRYSEIVYELFLWYINARITFDFKFDRWEFYQLIGLRRNAPYPDINNNGESELAFLNARVQNKLRMFEREYPLTDIKPMRKRMIDLGVRADNVYLFLRGHNLFDSVVSVGRKVCEKLLENRKIQHYTESHRIAEIYSGGHDFEEHIKHNFSFGKYSEIIKIEKDIDTFFSLKEQQH